MLNNCSTESFWGVQLTGAWLLIGLIVGVILAFWMVGRRPHGVPYIWYFVYIVMNVLMLGSPWFFRNLITYAVRSAQKKWY